MSTKGDRLWGGGYEEATHPLVQRMNASVSYDQRMAREDIIGSVAHATMLRDQGIMSADDHAAILSGLRAILADISAGTFEWSEAREDVHMNIEASLRDRIGAPAGRLHTARSRNDQVALDERLWLRRRLLGIATRMVELIEALSAQAWEHRSWAMCGYTHLQRAQPVTVGHHLLAHVEAFERDLDRVLSLLRRMDVCPLGAGALAGTTLPIDRARTAELLGFSKVARNSLDAVSDRDHLLDTLMAAATGMTHISRIGEELVLFASAEFGYIRLPDAFTTGSSLMPQKKNPDMAELIRGKSGRVAGSLVSLLMTLKGLPLAYNKDMQEDKEPLFDAVDTWEDCLVLLRDMLPAAKWQKKNLSDALDKGFLLATDLADVLVRNGVPFRDSHEHIAVLVNTLVKEGTTFRRAGAKRIAETLKVPHEDVADALNIGRALRKRDVVGAPHPARVGREAKAVGRRAAGYRKTLTALAAPCPAETMLG
ncbi:MAG: argininosuccinate lyase [Myxococcales bacterium]|nr:argininosuccinate lyase [Myxococcales bacterium]